MNTETRKVVIEYADENGYPRPGTVYKAIYNALIVQYRLSLVMKEIDITVDRITLLNDRINLAIEEGNLTALVLLKDRKNEELAKLKAYERILDKEAPVPKQYKGSITDEMIEKARNFPFEELLPEGLKRGRCRCPIHTGNNVMSFSVKNNYGKCWSCGWYGDSIKYVMDTQGLSFVDAVRRLQ